MNSTPLRMPRSSSALAPCLAVLLLLASCASGEPVDENLEPPSGGGSAGAAGAAGTAGKAGSAGAGNKGGAAGASGGSAGSAGSAGQAGASGAAGQPGSGGSSNPNCHLVINEIQVGSSSSGSDEFIEIFNPCSSPEDLSNWKLIYRSASGTSDTTLFVLSSLSIGALDYLVIGGSAFTGAVDATYTAGGLAASGGGLALRDASGGTVDSIGYGSANNGLVEGSSPPEAPEEGSSLARVPNGTDTDSNAADFQQVLSPTPGSAN